MNQNSASSASPRAKYPKYKPSGVEWLGSVPEHWSIQQLRYLTFCYDGKRIPLNAEERGEMPGDYPYWGANGIVDYLNDYIFDDELILLGEDGAPFFEINKTVAFKVSGKIWVNNHAHILKPKKDAPSFITYALNNTEYRVFINGSTRDKLTQSDMNSIPIPLPPLPEQQAIAAFLDRETGRIDALIAKKERLLELLAEQRTALISRAVTKGLYGLAKTEDVTRRRGERGGKEKFAEFAKQVQYKPSGVEWLGSVPEHWGKKRLRFLVDSVEQGWSPQANSTPANEGELGVLKLSAVSIGRFLPNENKMIEDIPSGQVVIFPEKGDVLITRANTPELVGDSCCLKETYRNLIIADLIYRIKVRNIRIDGFYLVYFLLTREGRVQIESLARGASGSMVKLGQGHLKDFLIPLPPLPEQQAIAAFLDRETAKIDALSAKVATVIGKLKEYRTALISSAVTGKIDVREAAGWEEMT